MIEQGTGFKKRKLIQNIYKTCQNIKALTRGERRPYRTVETREERIKTLVDWAINKNNIQGAD